MSPRTRWLVLAGFAVVVAGLAIAIALASTPAQPLTLAVLMDTGTETLRTVDRLGKLATEMPMEEEIMLGAKIAAQVIPGDDQALEDGGVRRSQEHYLAGLVRLLVDRGGLKRPTMPYNVRVLPSPEINAFALPGGFLVVTSGMLEQAQTEAEIASVLGHEIAHVDLKHCIERLQYEQAARKLGGDPLAALVGLGTELMTIGFSDDLEKEADRVGTIYAVKASYHPQGGQRLFVRLVALFGEHDAKRDNLAAEVGGMVGDALGGYFRTHPKGEERIEAWERLFAEQGYFNDDTRYYVGRQNYVDGLTQVEKDLASEWATGRLELR